MVRHLLAGRVVVAVHRNRLDAQALQCNQHLFAQLAGAEQHNFGGVGGQRGSEGGHGGVCEREDGQDFIPFPNHFCLGVKPQTVL